MTSAEVHFGKWLSQPQDGDEVVISGISGRLPESNNISEFRDSLFDKKDLVTTDDRRWSVDHPEIPQRNAKIFNIDKFDCGHFGLHKRQADNMDPMMRIFLEVAVESIMDAGVNPSDLEGTRTGVFVGACFADTECATLTKITKPQTMAITGYLRSFIPNRISYHLKLKGPSCIVDTACSSSLNALEHAFRAIRTGECDSALVGGVNLLLHPGSTLQFYRLGVLSYDGRCKVFDQNADGYVRGETIACIYLQKAKDAKRIYGKIVHAKINCDGYKSLGITYPSSEMQQQLMGQIFDESGLTPSHLSFLEAHGTGTVVGDPQEVKAIDNALAKKRREPLLIGSVKCSIGHTEPASGLCSLIKVIIAMETGHIPPNIHLDKIKAGLEGFEEGRLKVVTETTKLEAEDVVVGINNFGFGGNNCHLIVQRFNKKKVNKGLPADDIPRLVCVSGRTAQSVSSLLDYLNREPMDEEYVGLLHQLFKKNVANHHYRGYTILSKTGPIKTSFKFFTEKYPLYILFGRLDKSFRILGKHLLNFPVFKATLLRINDYLPSKHVNIIDTISQDSKNGTLGMIAVQIGIVDVLKTVGLSPSAVYGDSFGKIACAYYYDAITLEEAILTAYKFAGITENNSTKIEKIICDLGNNEIKIPDKLNYNESIFLNISDASVTSNELSFVEGGPVKFLEILGGLYQQGHNLALYNLYPKIEYPVSIGTPMVSPLIKWHHKKRWCTYKFSGFKTTDVEQREFYYSRFQNEHKFIAGHVIDGRNLFPATGYLELVWETYVQSRKLLTTDVSIVFENCKFIKAATMPKNGYLNFLVAIQKGTGNFEILLQNSLVATGRVYSLENANSERANYVGNVLKKQDPASVLEQEEIYRELYLRGYNYSGLFKGIVMCNVEVTEGLIKWDNNWITFMDNMLQIALLQKDSRLLHVPTGIKKLVIEPLKLLTFVNEHQETSVPVTVHKQCNLVKTYGIEIYGIKANAISRKKSTSVPVLEKHDFVPNHCFLDLTESVRVIAQIILENSLEYSFKAIELADDSTDHKFLIPLFGQVLEDVPLVNPDLTLATKATLEEIPGIKTGDFTLTPGSNFLLIVGTKILQRSNLTSILTALNRNGFVLTREETDFVPRGIEDIEIMTQHVTDNSTLTLFRKAEKFVDTRFIKVSSDHFEWLPEVQSSLKLGTSTIVYSQNQDFNGIMGLVNCLRREPGGNKVKCFFMMDEAPEFNPEHPFYLHQIKKQLAVNIYKNCKWGTYRHLLLEDVKELESEHCYVNTTTKRDLSSLRWIQGPLTNRTRMNKDSVLIHTYYCAVNFKDIMIASGRINANALAADRIEQECLLGMEYSGRDLSGNRVMGLTGCASLSTLVLGKKNFCWTVPDTWSLEDAATVPIVYSTVIYALFGVISLKPGTSILIHSATGGIGIAALNVCLFHGCEVFATVGTQDKRDYLKKHFPQVPESHVGNSHDTSFEEMIKGETNGRGVDIVLNSLSEEKLKASVRCLARGGRFLEIGKFDIANDNALDLLLLERGCSYHGIMLDEVFAKFREAELWLTDKVDEGISLGFVKPLPRTVFKQDEVEKAFRYMTTGKHMGKVLIKVRKEEEEQKVVHLSKVIFKGIPRFHCDPEKTYIIIGGLGGFGMELADWLMLRGAKKLILVSTTGIKTGYQKQRIRIWESYGVSVKISKSDATTKQGCVSLLDEASNLGPVDGIFNLAVVLQDALFENQTEEKFHISLAPKARATLYLDQATRELCPNLRYFVVFSSVSCGRGNAGQTNYGMANSIMERICEKRKRDGFPALAIQWGAIGEVGLVAKMQRENRELVIGGTLQQRVSSCLEVLDKFLKQDHPVVASMVVAEKRERGLVAGSAVNAVADILGIKDTKTINKETVLPEIGMDSITATEIIQLLEKDFEIYVTVKEVRNLTFARLMELEARKKDDTQLLKIAGGRVDFFLQHIPDNKTKSILPVVKLSHNADAEEEDNPVLLIPGIDGSFVPLEPLINSLNAHIFGVQYNYHSFGDSIEENAKTILSFIQNNISKNHTFRIIAYSFGCLIALELASLLESEGHMCDIIAIDGSPTYLSSAVKEYLKIDAEADFQTELLFKLLTTVVPIDLLAENKDKFLKCENFEDRIDLGLKLIPHGALEKKLNKQDVIALYKRFKSIVNYNFSHDKIKSSVNLYRTRFPMINGMEDDYKFSEFCEEPVHVAVLDGDHATILRHDRLIEDVNKMLTVDNNRFTTKREDANCECVKP